jgi:hypothetical protein
LADESFFREQRPVAAEGLLVEELNGVMSDLEGAARDTAIPQPDQIRAHEEIPSTTPIGDAALRSAKPFSRVPSMFDSLGVEVPYPT